MTELTLSPCVFAVPPVAEGRAAFELYLAGLLDWEAAMGERWIRVSIPEKTLDLLFESDSYPSHPHIAAACKTFGIFEYSVNDCRRIIDDILSRAVTLEDVCGLRDVLWTKVTFEPDISIIQREHFQEEVRRILVILATIRKHCDVEKINHILGCRQLPEACRSVAVEGVIEMTDPDNAGGMAMPCEISQDVSVCDSFSSFVCSLDPNVIWCAARDYLGAELAIKVAWLKECERSGEAWAWDGLGGFKLGSTFLSSAQNHGFCDNVQKSKPLLSRIVDTLVKRNLNKVHAIRTRRQGGSPQRLRGNDKAMRRDINYTYHLHYWETEGGVPEFAAVVTHDDFRIPE